MSKQSHIGKYSKISAPKFGSPTPHNPMTGKYETLLREGFYPLCALLQVAAEDTHDDYVICRGFDTRERRFFDYVEGDADKKGIAVAKPYGMRGINTFEIGEIHAAFLPIYQFTERNEHNQNPGKAETTVGHPEDLDEDVVFLTTDDGIKINWMITGEGAGQLRPKCHFTLDEELTTSDAGPIDATIVTQYGQGADHDSTAITVYNLPTHTGGVYEYHGDAGDYGIASYASDPDDITKWYIDTMECP